MKNSIFRGIAFNKFHCKDSNRITHKINKNEHISSDEHSRLQYYIAQGIASRCFHADAERLVKKANLEGSK